MELYVKDTEMPRRCGQCIFNSRKHFSGDTCCCEILHIIQDHTGNPAERVYSYRKDGIKQKLQDCPLRPLDEALEEIQGFNPKRQIALIWSIADVQGECPHLTDEQAMAVLEMVKAKHDANCGVTWETLRDTAGMLYPE